jgi:hypothetical protein
VEASEVAWRRWTFFWRLKKSFEQKIRRYASAIWPNDAWSVSRASRGLAKRRRMFKKCSI